MSIQLRPSPSLDTMRAITKLALGRCNDIGRHDCIVEGHKYEEDYTVMFRGCENVWEEEYEIEAVMTDTLMKHIRSVYAPTGDMAIVQDIKHDLPAQLVKCELRWHLHELMLGLANIVEIEYLEDGSIGITFPNGTYLDWNATAKSWTLNKSKYSINDV